MYATYAPKSTTMKTAVSRNRSALAGAVLLLAATFLHAQMQMPAPTVALSEVTTVRAVESRRFTGLLLSPSRVNLVVRVSGELLEVGFKEGDLVQKGQMLYRLDNVRYDAAVKQAGATVEKCKASLDYSESNFNRVKALFDKNVTTKDALEAAQMAYYADKAGLRAAEAALTMAGDDLNNTVVAAPITGKIGVNNFTVGNYLTPSAGVLATVVQLDPIRLSFSISNRDFLTLFGSAQAFVEKAEVTISLADGREYGRKAAFEFFNNEANRATDTRQIYMLLPNPDLDLLPNSTVAVNLTLRDADEQCAIVPSDLMSDEKGSYVYVVGDDGVAQRRDIVTGAYDGKLQVVKSGLKAGERVVSEGTHKVIPGAPVKAE